MKKIAIALMFISNIGLAQLNSDNPNEEKREVISNLWHFGLGGSYSFSSKLEYDKITITGYTGNLTASADYSEIFSIELEVRKVEQLSWGFIGGVSIDGERKLTRGTISGAGLSIPISSSDPSKIQTTVIFGNAVYRWNQFYLPFGLNFSKIIYTPPSSYTGTWSTSGGLGAQIGIGFYLNENLVMEAFSRAVAVKRSSTSSGTTVDYGTGYLSNLQIAAKYIF